jgi:hypothetical protein
MDETITDDNPQAPGESGDVAESSASRWIELIAVLVLTLGTVGAAWSGYQNARWGGEQATATANANGSRVESSRAQAAGGQLVQIDVALFFKAANAIAADDVEREEYYVELFREEFRPAWEAWLATEPMTNPDALPTPFDLDIYEVSQLVEAERLEAETDAFSAEAADARSNAEIYGIVFLLIAAALFFVALSPKFTNLRNRVLLLALGTTLFVVVAILLAALPKSVSL